MTTIFQYLPDVLTDIILEYHGGILHREKMIELKREIEREGIIKLMERTKSYVFKEDWGYNEAERIINYFEKCQCCERHKKCKPNSGDLQSGIVSEYSTKLPKHNLCSCPCRHYCRELCRDINEVVYYGEIEPWDDNWPWG